MSHIPRRAVRFDSGEPVRYPHWPELATHRRAITAETRRTPRLVTRVVRVDGDGEAA